MFDRKAHCKRIASKGGRATVEKYGKEHMSAIGQRGFVATTCRYFLGSEKLHKHWLIQAGAHAYWKSTGLTMKRDAHGRGLWPEDPPVHPAATVAPGQVGLFESRSRALWDSLPF